MTATFSPSAMACPGCAVTAPVEVTPMTDARIILSVPTIHCAGCISKIETALNAMPQVHEARVNLTLKRASINADANLISADVIAVINDLGFEAQELDAGTIAATQTDKAGRALLMRLAVAGFASMNVMLLSVAVWSGAEAATRDLFHWVSAAITLPAIAFCAQPFFKNAWAALRNGALNMDVPITLAILLAAGTSLYETANSGHHAYFDAAMTLTFFLLAGRYLDHRTRAIARSAAEELAALEVPRAIRIEEGKETEVHVADLNKGDIILVRPGGRMPVDGIVISGTSEIDRSLITGETLPLFAGPETEVSAGEVNLTGPLNIQATAVGKDTSLHRMADLVAVAESGRSRYTSLADKAAKLYAPGVHILSALSFVGWYLFTFDLRTSINIAAAVLIITCPCALGLAVPAVTTAASGRLFRRGMLIKDGTALERLAQVDTVVFDKTGTLTQGAPELTNLGDHSRRDLQVALSLAETSSHPLAKALTLAARDAGIKPADVKDIKEIPGYGVEGRWQGKTVRLGRASWLGVKSGTLTSTLLWIEGKDAVHFTYIDRLRDGAETVVKKLQDTGKTVILMSGDTPAAVEDVARRLGIRQWFAEALPGDKSAHITKLTDNGAKVLMVGDGLNDTAALAAATVSISPASALDAARVASDIVLLGKSLGPIPDAITTAYKSTCRISENFRIATLYNIIAVPIAIAGLATPLAAALAMSLSSITVSLNALRLK